MKNKIKIAVVTGSRAEYGILSTLLKKLDEDSDLRLQLIATGSHLSPSYGYTKTEIEKDLKIDREIEILLSSKTRIGVAKAMGLGIISFSEALNDLAPDYLLVLGDRFEVHAASTAAVILGIPIVHLHGGELTRGSWDESLRHSITKLAQIHFTTTETYQRRVIQMGENPDHVFNVGALGVENIANAKLLAKAELASQLGLDSFENTILVTVHSETNKRENESGVVIPVLKALDQLVELRIIFTFANSDQGGAEINQRIEEFVQRNSRRAKAFKSLGQTRYLSLLPHVSAVVGNSSSGIIEVPSFRKPTLNIGSRQEGRIRPDSVVDCKSTVECIKAGILHITQPDFHLSLKNIVNPYEQKNTALNIIESLKKIDPSELTTA